MRWRKVSLIDKVYYEPVYIINEDDTNIVIIRTVDGDYYASDKNALLPAPKKENILDSLQSLIHGFINRSNESSLSFKKPLYSLMDNDGPSLSNDNKILKRCQIFSFFPMLQEESYKLEGFIFKSNWTKMNIHNVQLFH